MNIVKLLSLTLTSASLVLLAACQPEAEKKIDDAKDRLLNKGAHIEFRCDFGAMFEGTCGARIKRGAFVSLLTDQIDVALGAMLLETTGAVVTASNAPVMVSLSRNGQLVAANSFTYSKYDQELKFDQPSTVNAWVNSYSGQYDTMDAELTGMQVVSVIGANSVTITEKIGPFSMNSATKSWTRSAPLYDDVPSN